MKDLKISWAAARINARMTQSEAAKALGVGNGTILSWEKGYSQPKVKQAIALSRLYGIPLDNIFLPKKLS